MSDRQRARLSSNRNKGNRSASTSQVTENPVGATGGSVTCSSCSVALKESDHCIQCDKCDKWNCLTCANISESLYSAMTEENYTNVKFFCTKCETTSKAGKHDGKLDKQDSSKIMTMLSQVLDNQKATSSQLQAFETKLSSLDSKLENYDSKVEEIVENKIKQKFGDEAKQLKSEIVDEVRELVSERHEREIRERNLILLNVSEPTSTDKTERHHDEIQKFAELCEELGETNYTVNKIHRIGKKTNDKHRPLKVVLANKTETKNILAAAKNLQSSANEELKAISIAPDYTPA